MGLKERTVIVVMTSISILEDLLFGIQIMIYREKQKGDKRKMTEDKRNVLRLAKDGEGTCLDCEWGTCLFGGSKGAVCLHTGKKNINELTRCDEYSQSKE